MKARTLSQFNLAAERAKRKAAARRETQAETLAGIGRQVPLFRSSAGETYADIIPDDSHRETHRIKSAGSAVTFGANSTSGEEDADLERAHRRPRLGAHSSDLNGT